MITEHIHNEFNTLALRTHAEKASRYHTALKVCSRQNYPQEIDITDEHSVTSVILKVYGTQKDVFHEDQEIRISDASVDCKITNDKISGSVQENKLETKLYSACNKDFEGQT